MNSGYCLARFQVENSANSQENVFNPFDFQHVSNNDSNDPDINFFNNNFDVVDSLYFSLEEILCKAEAFLEFSFSVVHVTISSLNKVFEKLLDFLSIMKNEFNIIAISQMRHNDDNINVNSLYQIPSYIPIH